MTFGNPRLGPLAGVKPQIQIWWRVALHLARYGSTIQLDKAGPPHPCQASLPYQIVPFNKSDRRRLLTWVDLSKS